MKASPQQVTLVIVTHNRPKFLRQQLASIDSLVNAPGRVIIVDNASGPETAAVIAEAQRSAGGYDLTVLRLEENVGGAGGFAEGVRAAMDTGAEWLWLMDDDVVLVPENFPALLEWTDRFRCFHGRRFDFDGSPFFCEQTISEKLGVQLPILPPPFEASSFFLTNWACFEGLLIHREIVDQIGLPDERFFIVWDDAIYGWLASKVTEVAFVDVFALRKIRHQKQVSLGLRHLNDSSDMSRFFSMRNRGLIREYFQKAGVFQPVYFGFGTLLVLAKELVRLVLVERSLRGVTSLVRGYQAYRNELRRDTDPEGRR